MTKTSHPGVVKLPHGTFQAKVKPDVFDDRDLAYRPRLQPLPAVVDARPAEHHVLRQVGDSCTGHAVAAMVNTVLAAQGDHTLVSPFMLYRLARRYDEYQGEADAGSSLRGALKGWYYHGVLPESDWSRLDMSPEPDVDHDARLRQLARLRPMGAFYRIAAARLDDLQSSVTELHAIVASAAIHAGWLHPTRVDKGGATSYIIEQASGARQIGGHAFSIVGYNEIGFLVQNSWGSQWGRNGFATLTYDDWLESAYDAWVARPGVASIVTQRDRRQTVTLTDGAVADGPGPDLRRLSNHVVNIGDNGRLSTDGRFVSTPTQIDHVFERMAAYHDFWAASPPGVDDDSVRRVILYAHGGLVSEAKGLAIASQQLNWWLNNRVYPVSFAWQSGPVETLVDQLTDQMSHRSPVGGIGFDLVEQFDRLVERYARSHLRWMWDEMKKNGVAASSPIGKDETPTWPAGGSAGSMASLPGASLAVSRLRAYIDQCPSGASVDVHLVGHSAGAIFMAGVLGRLAEAHIPVRSLTFLAPALRTDTWVDDVLPHLSSKRVQRFGSFGLSAERELDDVTGTGGVSIYHKSLLYLVSRAFEPSDTETEVPLVGMAHFADTTVHGTTLADAVREVSGDLVWAPSAYPADSSSDSSSHGGFDDDSATMTSVMLRVLGQSTVQDVNVYRADCPLSGREPPKVGGAAVGSASPTMHALQREGWSLTPP